MSTSTQGRVAVVTGASSGIGEATARALAADVYRVALLARRADRITTLADELDNGSIAVAADVSDRDSVVAAAARVEQELGGADVLVNNAGVMLLGPFSTDQRDDYRRMIEVNLLGAITTTEVFLDQLKTDAAERGGDIVNISSVAGRTARAGNGVYAETAGRRRKELDRVHGTQPGDPARAAAALVDAVESGDPPYLLLLGNDAVDAVRTALAALRDDIDTWETTSRSTDFDS